MMNYDYSSPVAQPEYHAQFWDMARHNTGKTNFLDKGHVPCNIHPCPQPRLPYFCQGQ